MIVFVVSDLLNRILFILIKRDGERGGGGGVVGGSKRRPLPSVVSTI